MDGNGESIPERVRARLLALGIPAAQHRPEALAGLFPREFNIGATGLTAEDMARVLVYLIEKKIISSPAMGGCIGVKKVRPGWHFCQFYRDFNQLLDMVAPYVAEGLRKHQGCLWVLPKVVSKQAACDSLARCVKDVDVYFYFANGQLEVLDHPTWYLNPSGRLKSFEQISKALLERQDRALARGFNFLRVAGDTGWVSGTEHSKSFIDYEMKVNAAIGAMQVAAVCTYRADVTADEFVSIVTAHQDAVYQETTN